MNIFQTLSLQVAPGRTEPDVWVRRMVIYRQVAPEPTLIREIKLTKGVNIVWAQESDDEQTPTEITGHSAGKTSFCRLFRYALGETTFGTKANTLLIQRAFPSGYLAAEVTVKGQLWAVLRPIGNGIVSYIKAGAVIEELLTDRSQSVTQNEYASKLGLNDLLVGLDAGAVLRTNRPIEWGHILAWCARDQEARFQNCHDWRSPRSDSEWPSFRSSKADPLFVMRAVLGLFLPDELQGEEELAELVKAKDELDKQLVELKKEPEFGIKFHDKELRRQLREHLPTVQGIEHFPFKNASLLFEDDLDRLTDRAKGNLEADVSLASAEIVKFDEQIETLGGWIGVAKNRLGQLEATFGVTAAGQQEVEDGVLQRENVRTLFNNNSDATCVLGDVLYKKCPIVLDRQEKLKFIHLQDADALTQAVTKRAEVQRSVEEQKKEAIGKITSLQAQLKELTDKRKPLKVTVGTKEQQVRDLQKTRTQLANWLKKAEEPGEFKELDECRTKINETDAKIVSTKNGLDDLLIKHDGNRKLISSIFTEAIHGVLPSGGYDGQVNLANRELSFHIVRGGAMSGEAVETLAVLLADLACMVYNCVSERPRLPGFLLHDSPREADLSLRLYRHFITLAASLQEHFGTADQCPFQYIITTTTPPPTKLRSTKWVKLHLNAAVSDETLFRYNFANAGSTGTLGLGELNKG